MNVETYYFLHLTIFEMYILLYLKRKAGTQTSKEADTCIITL